jgi:hypothetical protein
MLVIGCLPPPAFYFAHWNLPKLTFSALFPDSDHAKFEQRFAFLKPTGMDDQSKTCDYALI